MQRKRENLNQLPLKVNKIENSGQIIYNHWHNHIELIMLLSGEANVTVGKYKFLLKEGEIAFINRNLIHGAYSDEKCHLLGLVIPVNDISSKIPIDLEYNPIITDENLSELIFIIYREYKHNDFTVLKSYSELITKLIFRKVMTNSFSHYDSGAIDYINKHYSENITLSDIADSVNLSKYYFSHYFKNQYGITVSNYLTNLRIEKSLELLNENKKTAEIAERCGFSDDCYFCRVFKKVMGITVRDYRKLNDT